MFKKTISYAIILLFVVVSINPITSGSISNLDVVKDQVEQVEIEEEFDVGNDGNYDPLMMSSSQLDIIYQTGFEPAWVPDPDPEDSYMVPPGWDIDGQCVSYVDGDSDYTHYWNDIPSIPMSKSGSYAACCWWNDGHGEDNAPNDISSNEWLKTMEFDFSEYSYINLTFWSVYGWGSQVASHSYVKVSTNGGSSWQIVTDLSHNSDYYKGDHVEDGVHFNYYEAPVHLDLSNYGGEESVIIAWHYYCFDPSQYDTPRTTWAIDDVAIYGGNYLTVLAYMNGDNDLEEEVINDFLEMAEYDVADKMNIVVQLDRHASYDSRYGDWTGACRFNITQGKEPRIENAEMVLNNVNMGNPGELSDFITWGMTAYPAVKYILLLDGPGDGWRGITSDWTSQDILTVVELRNALQNSLYGEKLSLIGFDVPYTASLEVAYEIKDHANYMIGSEDITPESGWPYDEVLLNLESMLDSNSEIEDVAFVQPIYDEYCSYYSSRTVDATISAFDLSKINDLANAVDSFGSKFSYEYNFGNSVDKYVLRLALATSLEDMHISDPSLIDLQEFASSVQTKCQYLYDFSSRALAIQQKCMQVILFYHAQDDGGITPSILNGINIYLPFQTIWEQEESKYNTLLLSVEKKWDSLLSTGCPEHSVYYRRYAPLSTLYGWQGEIVKGGWNLYDSSPSVFDFVEDNNRMMPRICAQVGTMSGNPSQYKVYLQHVDVILQYDGNEYQTFTDDFGNIMFPSEPMVFVDGKQARFIVTLRDKGVGSNNIIRIIDYSSSSNIIVSHMFPTFTVNARNLLHKSLDFWNLGGRDRNWAFIYYHLMQAVECAKQVFVLDLTHIPVNVRTYSTTPKVFYNDFLPHINIEPSQCSYMHPNSPDNREWHEFGHHVMADSSIGGANHLPTLLGTNHGGYDNPNSADAWIEGFAEFFSCVVADTIENDPHPELYNQGRGRTSGSSWSIERNYFVDHYPHRPSSPPFTNRRGNEEQAVASILWDLYDGLRLFDRDAVDLTIDQIWDVLNHNLGRNNLYDIYHALDTSGLPGLHLDADGDGKTNLDEIFISRRCYNDQPLHGGNNRYDIGEDVGLTSWQKSDGTWHTNRHNMPLTNDSFMLITVTDIWTGEDIDGYKLYVQERNPSPYEFYDIDYTITVEESPYVYITLPCDGINTEVTISIGKDGYYTISEPLVFDTEYYLDHLGEDEYFLDHTFYLGSYDILYVDDDADPSWYDYIHVATIQEAVDLVNENGTIYVADGQYDEQITIYKPLYLIGDNRDNTIIDGQGEVAITVTADNVSISNFTVKSTGEWGTGIYTQASNTTIYSNNITDSCSGIAIGGGNTEKSNNVVHDNLINNNQAGISIYYSNENTISYNTLTDNDNSIYIEGTHNNTIFSNVMNDRNGIDVALSGNNVISQNTINVQRNGISLLYSDSNIITENIINGTDSGYYPGMSLHYLKNNTISKNVITNFTRGIELVECYGSIIQYNKIADNTGTSYYTSNGILIFDSFNNTIRSNLIKDNTQGITIDSGSEDNKLYHNTFINNAEGHAYDEGTNQWDNGYPSGGNYWDDHSTYDTHKGPNQDISGGDGIVDMPGGGLCPYVIYIDYGHICLQKELDFYPFTRPVVDPVQSVTELTNQNEQGIAGLLTCPDPTCQNKEVYDYLKITVIDHLGRPIKGLDVERINLTASLVGDTESHSDLEESIDFIPVDQETNSAGEIRFTIETFTSIGLDDPYAPTGEGGAIAIEVTVQGVPLSENPILFVASCDIDLDGTVDLDDFCYFGSDFGKNVQRSDFNFDGNVNLIDFTTFSTHFRCKHHDY